MGSEVGIAILTGGLSKRMGTAKENLEICIGGEKTTFLEHLCKEFSGFEHKYLSVNRSQSICIPGYVLIKDEYDEIGPVGGIYSVLKRADVDALLIVACDMPRFSKEAAEYFILNWDGKSTCIATLDGRREPLAGIYAKSALPFLEEQIRRQEYKVGLLHERIGSRLIDMSDYREAFTNINTMSEYTELSS